jgi:hypothetical protein
MDNLWSHNRFDSRRFYLLGLQKRQDWTVKSAIFGTIFIVASIGAGLWIGLMLIDKQPPFHYLGAEYGSKMLPNPARSNEMMSTDWFLSDVQRECPREVNRIFSDYDSKRVITALDATPINKTISTDTTDHRQEDGKGRLSRSFLLPSGLPARTGYHVETCFYCNVLQTLFPPARICIKSPVLLVNVIQ